MIKISGKSEIGQSHIGKGNCQDACYFREMGNFAVLAVADGLGSSKCSDVASEIASKRSVDYCIKGFQDITARKGTSDDIISMIKKVFDQVNFEIKHQAGSNLDDYDTTLTLAIYVNGRVFYGHAGDSGIIALRSDGKFECVTEPQNAPGVGKERPVYPLAAQSHWKFGTYPSTARALFLMTDGVWNKCVPPLLEGQQYELDHKYLYYLYSSFNRQDLNNRDSWLDDEVSAIAPNEINYDDKTLVMAIDDSVTFKPESQNYYDFPNDKLWGDLLRKHEDELYPYRNQPKQTGKGSSVAVPQNSPVGRKPQGSFNNQSPTQQAAGGSTTTNIKKGLSVKKITTFSITFVLVITLGIVGFMVLFNKSPDIFADDIILNGKVINNINEKVKIPYDTKPHVISIEPINGAVIKYGEKKGLYNLDFPPSIINVGEVTVYYEVTKKGQKHEGEYNVTITPLELDKAEIEISDKNVYTGDKIEPILSIKINEIIFSLEKDFTVEYINNIEVGTATAILMNDKNNNIQGIKRYEFIISKAEKKIAIEKEYKFTALETSLLDDITKKFESEGQLIWYTDDSYTDKATFDNSLSTFRTAGDIKTLFWEFIPKDKLNYEKSSGKIKFELDIMPLTSPSTTNEQNESGAGETKNNSLEATESTTVVGTDNIIVNKVDTNPEEDGDKNNQTGGNG